MGLAGGTGPRTVCWEKAMWVEGPFTPSVAGVVQCLMFSYKWPFPRMSFCSWSFWDLIWLMILTTLGSPGQDAFWK